MKKALIFYGGWEGHTPKETAHCFRQILEAADFEVTMSDSLSCLDVYEDITQYDLFVPVWTMGTITGKQCLNICKAVDAGAGIAGCHGGMCDSFRENTEWQFMTGSQWVAHPGNATAVYDVYIKSDSPLVAGMENFTVQSEQYYIHVDPAVQVHATTKFPVADGPFAANGEVQIPVVYTKFWGKGKVYYNSLGHTANMFDQYPVMAEMMRRGFLWASR